MIKFELHHNLFIERSKTTTKKAIGCPKKMSCLSIKLPITNTYMIMTGNISFLLKHAPWNSSRKVLSCAGHTWVSSAFQKHFPCTASRMLHSAWFSTCALALPLHVCGLYISKCPRVQSSGLSFSISQSWLHKIITWRTFHWKSARWVSQPDHLSQHLRVLGLALVLSLDILCTGLRTTWLPLIPQVSSSQTISFTINQELAGNANSPTPTQTSVPESGCGT